MGSGAANGSRLREGESREGRGAAFIAEILAARALLYQALRAIPGRSERAEAARDLIALALKKLSGQDETLPLQERLCQACGKVLPLEAFEKDSPARVGPTGRGTRCRACKNAQIRRRSKRASV